MTLYYTDFLYDNESKKAYIVEIQKMLEKTNDPMTSYYSDIVRAFDDNPDYLDVRDFEEANFFLCKITRFGQLFVEICTEKE